MKVKNSREIGLAPIALLIIVVLGIAVGGGAYLFSKKSINIKPITPEKGIIGQTTPEISPNSQTLPNEKKSPVLQTSPTPGNFTQKGNLSLQKNGEMFLVWDVPGNPAVNVQLKFTDQSICLIAGKNDCSQLKEFADGLAYCNIEGNKVGNKVTVAKLEELKLP